LISEKYCTGCSACFNICPKHAITMGLNTKGFLIPSVSQDICVNCGLCDNVCLNIVDTQGNTPYKVFASFSKKQNKRQESTSGGIFTSLAENFIKSGGIVFGASLQTDLSVKHISVSKIEELTLIKKSKYLQSEIGSTYFEAKSLLQKGKKVLFSGTPCQIAGLYNYLGKKYKYLFTVDLLCHGIPSRVVFNKYLSAEETKSGFKMTDFLFREKEFGWKNYNSRRVFSNNLIADWPDTFVPGYLSDLFLNDSCYECRFANLNRQGDISLGDYWGYKETAPEYVEDDNKGINLVLINTDKGYYLYKKIKHNIVSVQRTAEDAIKGNPILVHPALKPLNYAEFWNDFEASDWYTLVDKYFQKQNVGDILSESKKEYFNQPYHKRHLKHWIKHTKQYYKKKYFK